MGGWPLSVSARGLNGVSVAIDGVGAHVSCQHLSPALDEGFVARPSLFGYTSVDGLITGAALSLC